MPNYRIEASMTFWERKVRFLFGQAGKDTYQGSIVFPDKVDIIQDVLKKAWVEIVDNENDFPFGDLSLELKSIKGWMQETKDYSLVAFNILVGGILVTVYYIKKKGENTAIKAFTLEPKGNITMDSLPGVNMRLPQPIKVGMKFTIASGMATIQLNGEKKFKKGFSIDGALEAGGEVFNLGYWIGGPSSSTPVHDTSIEPPSLPKEIEEPQAKGAVKWKKLNKKIGKIATIYRVGFLFKDNKITLFFDLDVFVSKLGIGLIGLNMSLDLKYLSYFKNFFSTNSKWEVITTFAKDSLSFGLNGMAIGLETKALTLGGILVKQRFIINKKTYEQYVGGLIIKTKAFNFVGLGAYGQIEGYKSFFFYGFLGMPIGGPPFFFVNGIALGFGYNRQVNVPNVEHVADFPLVSLVMGSPDKDTSVVGRMTKMIPMVAAAFPPRENHLFFAVGVKFNSFKLIDGFLLLLVSLGDKLRFDILGMFALVMPKDNPIVVLEVALKATVIPEEGTIQVEGLITDNSYILDRNARLTGKFAFYAWTKDFEDEDGHQVSAGDFVLSIGGYHPKFRRPKHYPIVPRVGLNWRVSRGFTIKAEAYFALTPSLVMAGGKLDAIFTSKSLDVWFKVYANFLVQWKPFYYDIEAGLEMGIEYRTILKTFHFSLSADINIWGPKFGGKATIDCTIIEETFYFGSRSGPSKIKITWNQFKEDFLPAADDMISLTVVDGLINERKEKQKKYLVVNSKEFTLKIDSQIPVTDLKVFGVEKTGKDFGLFPVQGGKTAYSTLEITTNESIAYQQFPLKKNLPAALWSQQDNLGFNAKNLVDSQTGINLKAPPPLEGVPWILEAIPDFEKLKDKHHWQWNNNIVPEGSTAFENKNQFGVFMEDFNEQIEIPDVQKYALRASVSVVKFKETINKRAKKPKTSIVIENTIRKGENMFGSLFNKL